MPTCGYLAITEEGAAPGLARRLAALPGCDAVPARNRNVLLLVTETRGPEEDEALRSDLQAMDEIHALLLAFGEIDPDTRGDP